MKIAPDTRKLYNLKIGQSAACTSVDLTMTRQRKKREELEAAPLDLNNLIVIKDYIFYIPRFQRSYCWDESNIKMLWEDIDSVVDEDETTTRFLGAIILKDYMLPGGRNFPGFDVIDGQQRLITFFMLLAVVTHKCWHRAEELLKSTKDNAEKAFARDLKDAAKVAAEGLICRSGRDKGRSKIVPSFIDMPEFNWALDYLDFIDTKVKKFKIVGDLKKAGRLEVAVELIDEHLTNRITASLVGITSDAKDYAACQYLDRVLTAVREELELIQVILAERHDANEVFDRLNLQGQELTVLDLLRNELFRVFGSDDERAIEFYEDHWLPFEERFVKPLEFLRNEENPTPFANAVAKHKSGFWYPFALTIDPDCTSSKKRIFETLRTHWNRIDDDDPGKKALKIVEELSVYVPVYNAITIGESPKDSSVRTEIWERVERVHQYNIPAGTYVYMFQLVRAGFDCKDKKTSDEICACLEMVESYIMRRAFCKDDGSVKNVFNPIWRLIGHDPRLLNYQLNDNNRPFYDDKRVLESLTGEENNNFYTLRERAKYTLLEYERSLPGDNPDPRSVTVDHIMPRTRLPNWKHIPAKHHESHLDRLGNLVVLTRRSNSSKSNRSWKETARLFRDESATKSPRKIANKTDWTIRNIDERTREIAAWAVTKRWPKPRKPSGKLNDQLRKRMESEQKDIGVCLTEHGISHAFIRKTKTGFNKGNITASLDLRSYLQEHSFHDYNNQKNGIKHKVIKTAKFYNTDKSHKTDVSLFRTQSKGECRIWPNGLNAYCGQWSLLVFHVSASGDAYIVNCSNPIILSSFIEDFSDK